MTDELKACRTAFEAWMCDVAKVIVGSADPYPAGIERDYWRVWQAAWNTRPKASEEGAVAWIVPQWRGMPDGSIEDGPDILVFDDDATIYETRIGTPLYTTPRATAEDVRDAERYRYLRNEGNFGREIDVCDDDYRIIEGAKLDQAIDAAIRSE